MPTVLVLSSYVAASRVGGGAQAQAFARLGIEPILVPTVTFGRHPGWGPPGGGPVAAETMQAMLDAIAYQGLFSQIDAVLTGYFSRPEQVTTACRALSGIRAANPNVLVIVDPVMGDAGKGLYVHAAVADAVTEDLVSRADLITPNAWELSRLSNHPVFDAASALAAARSMGRPVAVTSVEAGGEIGVVYADRKEAHLAVHARERSVPNGTGDLFCALMTAALMDLYAPREALAAAVGGVADAVADAGGLKELPITALPTELSRSDRVRLETLA